MSPAHVYVIVAGAHCKIGIAADPVERLSSVATGCPIPPRLFYVSETMPRAVASWVEKTVHLKLAACNTNLEWFEVSADEAKAAVQAAEFFA